MIGSGLAGLNGASFNEAIRSGWSSAQTAFVMGFVGGAVKGYIDVKAKTVSNADNATKPQTEATTQKNTTAGNNTSATVSTEPLPDLGKYPAGYVNRNDPAPSGTPNSGAMLTAKNAKPLKIVRYDIDGKAIYRIDFDLYKTHQSPVHGHQLTIPGNLGSAVPNQHIPIMEIPPHYFIFNH